MPSERRAAQVSDQRVRPPSGAGAGRAGTSAAGGLGVLVGVAVFALLLVAGPLAGGDLPGTAPGQTADPRTSSTQQTTQPAVRPSAPRELRVPSVGIEATVRPVAVGDDLVLRPPRDPDLVGWWDESAEPGVSSGGEADRPGASGDARESGESGKAGEARQGPRGSTVIAGHTVHDPPGVRQAAADERNGNSDGSSEDGGSEGGGSGGNGSEPGGGAMDRLPEVDQGAGVVVRTENGQVRYRVRSVQHYTKEELARRAEEIFAQDRPHRLVLVTCDDWNGTEYLSNVVIVAQPLPAAA